MADVPSVFRLARTGHGPQGWGEVGRVGNVSRQRLLLFSGEVSDSILGLLAGRAAFSVGSELSGLLDCFALITEVIMKADFSPLVSEFETEVQATRHELWLRARVQASLDDVRPNISQNQVMADMRALIESKRRESDVG